MSGFILYHNPRWGKSRGAVLLLDQNEVEYTVVEYLKVPLSKKKILSLARKLKMNPRDFVRTNEKDFKDNQLKYIMDDNEKMAEAISKFPKIMERPIFENRNKAVIGRPSEEVLKLIK